MKKKWGLTGKERVIAWNYEENMDWSGYFLETPVRKSRFIVHGDGWFPYYPWWMNIIPRQIISWSRKIGRRTGQIKGNQASWTDWKRLVNSEKWMRMYDSNKENVDLFRNCFARKDQNQEIEYRKLSIDQKMNFLQILVSVDQLSRRVGLGG